VIAAIIFHEIEVRRGLTINGAKENLMSVFSSDAAPVVRR